TRAAERRQPRALQRHVFHRFEEAHVLGVGAGPAAFDVVDSEGVEAPGYRDLVFARQLDVLSLRSVAQGGVVDLGCPLLVGIGLVVHGLVADPARSTAWWAWSRTCPATSLLRTSTYALAEASTTSVDRPRPWMSRASLRTRMVT